MSRLPDFLIVGAMKSGTTTLYEDLRSDPRIVFPRGVKEPESLTGDEVLTPEGSRAYAHLYRHAAADQLCGDASTAYTKRPDVEGVPRRSLKLLGRELRVIYIVRDPIARTISHHYHEFARGGIVGPLDEAVHRYPRLIDYSRYAYQLRPWLDTFGPGQVRVVHFESYVQDRLTVVHDLCRFLGLGAFSGIIEHDRAYNSQQHLPIPRGMMWRVSRRGIYRTLIRPLLPRTWRERLRRLLLPAPPSPPPPPSETTLRYLREQLAPDVEELGRVLGSPTVLWDLEASVRSRLEADSATAAA